MPAMKHKPMNSVKKLAAKPAAKALPAKPIKPPKPSEPRERRYAILKLVDLCSSPTNPRKHFDADQLQQLADSIKAKGVLEPILVRPMYDRYECRLNSSKKFQVVGIKGDTVAFLSPIGKDRNAISEAAKARHDYEVVAGDRRYRASKLAGAETIPCLIAGTSSSGPSE